MIAFAKQIARVVAPAGAITLLAAAAFAQAPPVTQAPPPIQFGDWTRVGTAGAATEYQISFPSALTSPEPVNNVVPLKAYVPTAAQGPVPIVLVLHYWGATDLRVERALCLKLAESGIGSATIALPYHLSRSPAGYRSGALAIQPDPDRLVTSMTQSVLDVRRALDFLCSRKEFDASRVGIAGTSLGSLVAALSYGVEPRIHEAAFMLGGVNLAHIIWTSSRVVSQREILRKNGYTESLLREQLASIEPSTYLKQRTTGRSLVIGARYDTIITQDSTEELIEDLHDPSVIWLDTGHYGGLFVETRLLKEVAKFFRAGFYSQPYSPPRFIPAPTVRLGAGLATGTEFDITIGIDLIRPRTRTSGFASFLMTPRGPRLFLGQGIDQGVSAGIFFTNKSTGIGVLWSTVL